MKFSGVFIGMIIFSMVLTGMWGFTEHLATNYGVETSKELDSLSNMEDIEEQMKSANDVVKDSPFKAAANIPFFTQAVTGLSMILKIFEISQSFITLIATGGGLIGLPPFITTGLTALFWLFIVFTTLSAIFGRDV